MKHFAIVKLQMACTKHITAVVEVKDNSLKSSQALRNKLNEEGYSDYKIIDFKMSKGIIILNT